MGSFPEKTLIPHFCIMLVPIQPLSLKNYAARFSALLYGEELQMEVDMREFDMERVKEKILILTFLKLDIVIFLKLQQNIFCPFFDICMVFLSSGEHECMW